MASHFDFGLALPGIMSLAGVVSVQVPVRDSCFWVDSRDSAWVVLLLKKNLADRLDTAWLLAERHRGFSSRLPRRGITR
jgi:hypothetical protein